ncbi:MAG: hypothetical protein C0406_03715 [Sideroxydans sp.]|nr:hypothetical protein [Sideroxydans sp.]
MSILGLELELGIMLEHKTPIRLPITHQPQIVWIAQQFQSDRFSLYAFVWSNSDEEVEQALVQSRSICDSMDLLRLY